MHQIVTEHPAVARVDRQLADLAAAAAKAQAAAERATAAYEAELAGWQGKRTAALLAGRTPPPPPDPPPAVAADAALFVDRRRELQAERERVLAASAAELDAALRERFDVLQGQAGEHVRQALGVLGEVTELAETLRAVRSARARAAVGPDRSPPPSRYGVDDVSASSLLLSIVDGEPLVGPDPTAVPAPTVRPPRQLGPNPAGRPGGMALRRTHTAAR